MAFHPADDLQFAGVHTSNILYKDRSQVQSLMHGSIYYSPGHMSQFHSLQTNDSNSPNAIAVASLFRESGVLGHVLLRSTIINATSLNTCVQPRLNVSPQKNTVRRTSEALDTMQKRSHMKTRISGMGDAIRATKLVLHICVRSTIPEHISVSRRSYMMCGTC